MWSVSNIFPTRRLNWFELNQLSNLCVGSPFDSFLFIILFYKLFLHLSPPAISGIWLEAVHQWSFDCLESKIHVSDQQPHLTCCTACDHLLAACTGNKQSQNDNPLSDSLPSPWAKHLVDHKRFDTKWLYIDQLSVIQYYISYTYTTIPIN